MTTKWKANQTRGEGPETVTNGSRETCEEVTAITGVEPARHGAVKPNRWWVFESRHSDLSAPSAAPHSVSALLPAGHAAEGRAALDIVHPVRVDSGGSFLSYELWPRALRKRDLSARPSAPTFYELQYRGRELRFNLTANPHLLAPGFVSETRRRGGLGRAHIRARAPACHLLGEVQDPELEGGLAAISACDGLVSALGELAGRGGHPHPHPLPGRGLVCWFWPVGVPPSSLSISTCKMGWTSSGLFVL